MMKITRSMAIGAAAFACAAVAAPALAQSVSTRPELELSQIASGLTEQGYRVLEIERDDGWFEVKAFDRSGVCVEMDVDRRSGEIVRTRRDDDCGVGRNRSSGAR